MLRRAGPPRLPPLRFSGRDRRRGRACGLRPPDARLAPHWSSAWAALGLAREERVIVSPRILQRFYNVHLIVEAMPRIVAAIRGARLLITEYQADVAYRDEIFRRVRALGLKEHVRFVGHVPYAE